MKHYIIVKFKNNYNYKYEINNIKNLFDEAKKIDGIEEITIKSSNSNRENRFDLMIEMELTFDGLQSFDNSSIHYDWKNNYGKYIENKTIFYFN